MPKLTRRKLEKVVAAQDDPWAVTLKAMYALCRRFPDHSRTDEIIAKTFIIGRTHAAAVERGVPNEAGLRRDTTVFYRQRVAAPLRRSGIDRHIEVLRRIRCLTYDNAPVVLHAHHRLLQVLLKSVGMRKRSFVSKYLHFHAPKAVPIFDSYAAVNLKAYLSGRVRVPSEWDGPADHQYAAYVARYLVFRDSIRERFDLLLTPRQIDRLLWKVPGQN